MAISTDRKWLKGRNKYRSGYCNDINKPAQCEGTKPVNHLGEPLPTCNMWDTCPCECHYRIDKMFESTGLPRQIMSNPDYKPSKGTFVMPEVVDDPLGPPAFSPVEELDGPVTENRHPAPQRPATAPLAHRRTDTGRSARGGLEAQVWDACRFFMGGTDEELESAGPITPKLVSDWIALKYKIPSPSTGAINAVWDRWTKVGFSTQEKKPNRFTGFVKEGTWDELARMKSAAKRNAKTSQLAARVASKR